LQIREFLPTGSSIARATIISSDGGDEDKLVKALF
jgi:hypothetical protein